MLATAANLPLELYDLILYFLAFLGTDHTRILDGDTNIVKVDRKEMGSCALVCRSWAKICQPPLFQTVILCAKEELEQLVVIMDSPLSRISRYIHTIELKQKGAFTPWIHLVLIRLFPKLSSGLRRVTLILDSPTPPGSRYPFRSIHGALPSCPPSFSCNIHDLSLRNVDFRSFKDLAHLVSEVPALKFLRGHRLTWPTPLPTSNFARPGPVLHDILFDECTDNWAAVRLLTAPRRRTTQYPGSFHYYLNRDEDLLMTSLIRIIEPCLPPKNRGYKMNVRLDGEPGDSAYRLSYTHITGAASHILELSPRMQIIMVHGLNLPSTPNDAITHIWTVTLDFVLHGRHTDFVTAYDWTEFDRNLFRLAQSYQLRKFCLGFRSQEDLDRFVEIGVPRMPHLSIIREVVFAIWNSKESTWKRELPQADVNLDAKHRTNQLWRT